MAAAATAAKPRAAKAKSKLAAVPDAPGSFVLPAKCKVSAALSSDRTRPILTHAYVRRRKDGSHWVIATDSYIAVAIKVEPEGNLTDGYIPAGALRLMERGQHAVQISDSSWKVDTLDGEVTFDCRSATLGAAAFPDLERLGMWDKIEDPAELREIGLNGNYIKRISDALGAQWCGLKFEIGGALRAVHVTPLDSNAETRRALQMPIRTNV